MLSLALALVAFSLVDPVPADQLRDFAADRPDLTEGPFTVDAGHLQLELDAVVGSFEGSALGVDVVGLNARVGLTDAVDMHLILPTVGAVFENGRSAPSFGDLLLRLKWNLFGNADGEVAVAVLPYVVVPADTVVSGGVIVPVNFNLPWELGLGTMIQVELVRGGAANEEIDALVVVSASLARGVVDSVGVYLEGLAQTQVSGAGGELWASTGTTWAATSNLQFDLGARARVLGGDPRVEGFVGAAFRH